MRENTLTQKSWAQCDLDEVLDAVRVVDAGQLDDDLVRALPLDERLRDAKAVDPARSTFVAGSPA